jgi:hypothetical protein
MPDNPLVVALLKELRDEALLTKTEAGKIIGRNRNQVAGTWNRNKTIIGPWPKIPENVKKNRACCFPIGRPGEESFHLCGNPRVSHPFLCEEHKQRRWIPMAKVLPLLQRAVVLRSKIGL